MRSMLVSLLLLTGCATTQPVAPPAPPAPATCDGIVFDLAKGTLAGLPATVSQEEVKRRLPCATGATEDGGAFNYGGGVFFLKHDFFMYTGKDFIEVRARFRGTVNPPLLRTPAADARATLGQHTQKQNWSFFTRPWGCLRLTESRGMVTELAAHYEPCASVMSWYDR